MHAMQTKSKIKDLKRQIANIARKHKIGHVPSCYSCLNILYILYSKIVNIKTR